MQNNAESTYAKHNKGWHVVQMYFIPSQEAPQVCTTKVLGLHHRCYDMKAVDIHMYIHYRPLGQLVNY